MLLNSRWIASGLVSIQELTRAVTALIVLLLLTATVFGDVGGLTVWTLHQETPNAASYHYCATPFSESFDSLYYRRHGNPEQIRQVLQAHGEGSSIRGISRTTKLAYNTVVSIVRAASQKTQLVHNQEVQAVETEAVTADEMWSFVSKNRSKVQSGS